MSHVEQIIELLKQFDAASVPNEGIYEVARDLIDQVFGSDERIVFTEAVEEISGIWKFKKGRTSALVWSEIALEFACSEFEDQTDNSGQIILYTGLQENEDSQIIYHEG